MLQSPRGQEPDAVQSDQGETPEDLLPGISVLKLKSKLKRTDVKHVTGWP